MTSSMTQVAGALPEPPPKKFTLEQANRALPYVKRIVADISEVYERIIELRQQLEHVEPDEEDQPQSSDLERRYQQSMGRLSDLVNELHLVGVELAHFRDGVVDFPANHAGREVVFTWRRGEKQVSCWRDVDAAFSERRRVAA